MRMPISHETRAALDLLRAVQDKVAATEDLKANSQVNADLTTLITVLESPVFTSILNIQDSLRELKRQVQLHPSILPADFDITPSGELVLNLPNQSPPETGSGPSEKGVVQQQQQQHVAPPVAAAAGGASLNGGFAAGASTVTDAPKQPKFTNVTAAAAGGTTVTHIATDGQAQQQPVRETRRKKIIASVTFYWTFVFAFQSLPLDRL